MQWMSKYAPTPTSLKQIEAFLKIDEAQEREKNKRMTEKKIEALYKRYDAFRKKTKEYTHEVGLAWVKPFTGGKQVFGSNGYHYTHSYDAEELLSGLEKMYQEHSCGVKT